MANAAKQRHVVLLEPHARATAVAETATTQFELDIFNENRNTCWKAFDDDDEAFSMGFTGGQETQHNEELYCNYLRVVGPCEPEPPSRCNEMHMESPDFGLVVCISLHLSSDRSMGAPRSEIGG